MDLWVVGKVNPENYKEWELLGVFSSEQAAIAVCVDEYFFVGKVALDTFLPIVGLPWPGAYYPVRIGKV